VTIPGDGSSVTAVRVEALTDPMLGSNGPGRTPHGNFVLSEITATVGKTPIKFARAEADFSQNGFPASDAIDGKASTGWAISGPGKWNVNRSLTLYLDKPVTVPAGTNWTFSLAQNYGGHHTLGRFRIQLAHPQPDADPRPLAERRRALLQTALDAWRTPLESKAVDWTVLKPTRATANVPVLQIQPDDSVLSTSDITKHDVYDVRFAPVPAGATALRLEVLPDKRLPGGGPGRVYYEGAAGDFFFNTLTATVNGSPVKFAKAVASFGDAATAIDNDPQSGWSISGGRDARTRPSSCSTSRSRLPDRSRCKCCSSGITRPRWAGSACRSRPIQTRAGPLSRPMSNRFSGRPPRSAPSPRKRFWSGPFCKPRRSWPGNVTPSPRCAAPCPRSRRRLFSRSGPRAIRARRSCAIAANFFKLRSR
jgi:hypothetical protein